MTAPTEATPAAPPSKAGQFQQLDRQAFDFRPDLLTIQQSPPSALPRVLLLVVASLIGLLLLWMSFAKLDVVATAPGKLVPLTYTKIVQPADAGVVADILVKDGDSVQKGQVLLRLDSDISDTELEGLTKDVAIKQLTLQRIEAELADKPFVPASDAPADIALQVQTQYRAWRQSYLDNLAQETENLNKAKADLAAAHQVLRKLQDTVPIYRQSADAYESMRVDGLVGKIQADDKKREFLERAQELKAQQSTMQSLQAVIAASNKKISGIRSNYHTQLENERIETLTQLNKSSQEMDKSSIKNGMLEIKAPTDGIVKDLTVTTKGAVVQAGSLLLNVVPKDEPVQAEVQLSNDDIGFVWVGQKAQIKIAAYPFQKYGLLTGEVIMVGADSSEANRQQNQGPNAAQQPAQEKGPNYRALVRLDQQQLTGSDGKLLHLGPGMAVTAELHQGRRTVMEYLLSPVLKVSMEAARER